MLFLVLISVPQASVQLWACGWHKVLLREVCRVQNEAPVVDRALVCGSVAVELKEADITCCLWL